MAYKRKYNNYGSGEKAADSKWEAKLRDGVLKDAEFHSEKIEYQVDHKYTPDWTHGSYVIEAKGRFRESSEASKYKWIRNVLVDRELVFLFMKPDLAMPHAKKRKKCGTKQTHAEWAEKNKFQWFTEDTIIAILK